MVRLVPATPEHVPLLAADMREGDRLEGLALGGEPLDHLAESLRLSAWAMTALDGERPFAMWGVAEGGTLVAPIGFPWCLTGEGVERHRRFFARQSREWVALMQGQFQRLQNVVDARYAVSCRWLSWLGFELGPEFPFAAGTFRWFSWERP